MSKEEQVIMALHDLYNKIGWLNKLKLAEQYRNDSFELFKSSEMACIEYIGDHADPNVTRLAQACYMTRSALSKMTKKLMKRGIIESYQKPENRKEVYFRLTEQGREFYNIHEEMTSKFIARDKAVFEQMSTAQIDDMLCFFERYSKHLDAEIKKMDVDG